MVAYWYRLALVNSNDDVLLLSRDDQAVTGKYMESDCFILSNTYFDTLNTKRTILT